ncbi:MAG: hypothetical protein ABIR06_00140 [Cyclobacteriaceae bacterium]
MNKWKIGFWITLLLLIVVTAIGVYSVTDQGVSLTYLRDSYDDTERDMHTLVDLINDTDLSKQQIKEKLNRHNLFEFMDFSKDEIQIERLTLIFKEDKLKRIEKQW